MDSARIASSIAILTPFTFLFMTSCSQLLMQVNFYSMRQKLDSLSSLLLMTKPRVSFKCVGYTTTRSINTDIL